MSGLPSTTSLVYLGDLQPAGPVKDGDSTFWCDSAACTAGVDLRRVTAASLVQYMLSRLGASPPLQLFGNSLMLALDTSTLGITTGGALTVIGGAGGGGEGGFPPGGAMGQVQINAGAMGFSGITMSGDATWNTSNGQLALTNVSSGGLWNQVTVNQKGLVTSGSNQPYLTTSPAISLTGDVSGGPSTPSIATQLAAIGAGGSAQGITYDTKGRVISSQNMNYATISYVDQMVGQAGGGTITGVFPGTGLTGGATVGDATLSIQNSVQLPGTPSVQTPPAAGANDNSVATTSWVLGKIGESTSGISSVTATAPIAASTTSGVVSLSFLASASLPGTPTVATPPGPTSNDNSIANTAWVTTKLNTLSIGVSSISATSPIVVNQSTGAVNLSMVGTGFSGTYQGLVIDSFGRVTGGSNMSYLTQNQSITMQNDVTGSGTTAIPSTVVALRGQPISTNTPSANQFLQYVGGQWTPQTVTLGGAGTVNLGQQGQIAGYPALGAAVSGVSVSGDLTLSGQTGVGRVTGLQNHPVSATAPTDLQLLQYQAANNAWVPATVSTGGNPSMALTGDALASGVLGGNAITVTVTGLRGRQVVNQTPVNGQVLAYMTSPAPVGWRPVDPGSLTSFPPGGDGPGGNFLPLSGGTLSGPGDLVINQNTVSLPGAPFFVGTGNRQPMALQIGGPDSQPANMLIDGFSWQPSLHFRLTAGTAQNPQAITTDAILGANVFHGYDGSNWTNGRGNIGMAAAEPWSTGHHGTYLFFSTMPPNTPQPFNTVGGNTVMRLYQGLVLGNPPDGDPGYGSLITQDRIIVNKNAMTIAPPPAAGQELAHFMQADGQPARIAIDAFGGPSPSPGNAAVLLRTARSPASAILPLLAGDAIGSYQFQGAVGDPANWFRMSAMISATATANFSTSFQPTKMEFATATDDQAIAGRMSLQKGLVIGNPAGGDLGYGTLDMDGSLTVNGSASPFSEGLPAGALLHLAGQDFARAFFSCFTDAAFSGAALILRTANGTGTAASALRTGDTMGLVGFGGYGSTGWVTGVSRRAAIAGHALQPWTDAVQGAELAFETTPIGGNVPEMHMRLRSGLMVGSTGSMTDPGDGWVNAQAGYKIGGVYLGNPVSAGWVAGTSPDGVALFINNSGRTLVVVAMSGVVEVANGTAANVDLYYAPPGTAIPNATTKLNTTAFNANGAAGGFQNLGSTAVEIAPNGGRIGLRVQAGATWTASVATITVFLV